MTSLFLRQIMGRRPRPLAWWSGLIALLLAEGLALSLLFDSDFYRDDPRWWATFITEAPRLLGRLVIAAAVMTPLICGRAFRDLLRRPSGPEGRHPAWGLLLGHLSAVAVFACITMVISRGGPARAAYPGGLVLAWMTMGAIALGTWVAALLPAGFGPATDHRMARRLLAVVAAAAIAVGVSQIIERGLWSPRAGSPLVHATFWSVSGLIGMFSAETVCRPEESVVGTRAFSVRVAPQCSGFEGMGLILVFLAAVLALWRRSYRFPHALLLLPLGVAAIWLANVLRISLLVAVGVRISPAVAAGGFHSQAGWLAFNLISLGLVLASRRVRFFARSDPDADKAEFNNPTAAYLVPLLASLATTMVTGAFSSGFDRFYPFRVLTVAAALWYFRGDYAALRWSWSRTAVAIGAGTFVLWMALEPAPTGSVAETELAWGLARLGPIWGTVWLAFRVAGSVVTVPIAEELAFRGYLTRRLIAAEFQELPLGRFTWPSFLISSAVFGLLHGRWLAGMLAGMAYAVALYRRGELADAMVAHATTNALIALYVLASGSWSLWM